MKKTITAKILSLPTELFAEIINFAGHGCICHFRSISRYFNKVMLSDYVIHRPKKINIGIYSSLCSESSLKQKTLSIPIYSQFFSEVNTVCIRNIESLSRISTFTDKLPLLEKILFKNINPSIDNKIYDIAFEIPKLTPEIIKLTSEDLKKEIINLKKFRYTKLNFCSPSNGSTDFFQYAISNEKHLKHITISSGDVPVKKYLEILCNTQNNLESIILMANNPESIVDISKLPKNIKELEIVLPVSDTYIKLPDSIESLKLPLFYHESNLARLCSNKLKKLTLHDGYWMTNNNNRINFITASTLPNIETIIADRKSLNIIKNEVSKFKNLKHLAVPNNDYIVRDINNNNNNNNNNIDIETVFNKKSLNLETFECCNPLRNDDITYLSNVQSIILHNIENFSIQTLLLLHGAKKLILCSIYENKIFNQLAVDIEYLGKQCKVDELIKKEETYRMLDIVNNSIYNSSYNFDLIKTNLFSDSTTYSTIVIPDFEEFDDYRKSYANVDDYKNDKILGSIEEKNMSKIKKKSADIFLEKIEKEKKIKEIDFTEMENQKKVKMGSIYSDNNIVLLKKIANISGKYIIHNEYFTYKCYKIDPKLMPKIFNYSRIIVYSSISKMMIEWI